MLALGYQRRRESHFRWIKQQIEAGVFGKLVNAEANISRDRLGQIDLTSWRYTAAGMPGGVMLQIGIHYVDVLDILIGPIKAVSGQSAQLVLPGDNPDVASLVLEHENGALSTLNASYASASEYYLMNIYGKEATAYYDLHHGLSLLKRGEKKPVAVPCAKNDTFVEELEEFAAAVRGGAAAGSRRRLRAPSRSRSSAPASCRRAKAAASRWRRSWRRIERRYFRRGIAALQDRVPLGDVGLEHRRKMRRAALRLAPERCRRDRPAAWPPPDRRAPCRARRLSLATMSFGVPFGAYIALQMLSCSRECRPALADGTPGKRRRRAHRPTPHRL